MKYTESRQKTGGTIKCIAFWNMVAAVCRPKGNQKCSVEFSPMSNVTFSESHSSGKRISLQKDGR